MALERLALIVRSAPWQGRSGRDALDLALAAATLDIALDLCFVGDGLLQLVAGEAPSDAGLPPGLQAWASLPDLGTVSYHAEAGRFDALAAAGVVWRIEPDRVTAADMAALQAGAQRILVA